MHSELIGGSRPDDRAVDAWSLLTGGSVGIVAGFAVDLLRRGLFETKRARAAHGWSRAEPPCGTCGAGAR